MSVKNNNANLNMLEEIGLEKNHFYRYERKFVVPAHYSLEGMKRVVLNNSVLFKEIFHERRVNNIYFDTVGYQYYLDNVLGVSDRQKVRIRWYGNSFGKVEKPVLEIKIKEGVVGDKWSFPLKQFTFDNQCSRKKIQTIFDASKLPLPIRKMVQQLEPSLVNSYRRQYYQSPDKSFRVTLDFDISYTSINSNFNNFQRIAQRDREAVVELKYNLDKDAMADVISKQFPFRMSKKSKYITGIECFKSFAD